MYTKAEQMAGTQQSLRDYLVLTVPKLTEGLTDSPVADTICELLDEWEAFMWDRVQELAVELAVERGEVLRVL